MKDLRNKVAVVTGGAKGIGRETALQLAQQGCELAICDIDIAELEKTEQRIRDCGNKVTVHRVDVSNEEQMRAFAEDVVKAHGRVNILVNNAGIANYGFFEEQSIADYKRVFDVNFWGVYYGCKFFLPFLKEQDEAHIVNISSGFGIVSVPIVGSYATSKFAVNGLSETLWLELRKYRIGVTTVIPGITKTDIARRAKGPFNPSIGRFRDELIGLFDDIGLDPAYVAMKIVNAIKNDQRRVVVGIEAMVLDRVKGLLPKLTGSIILALFEPEKSRVGIIRSLMRRIR